MGYWPHSNPDRPDSTSGTDRLRKRAARSPNVLTTTLGKPAHREYPKCPRCNTNDIRDHAAICHDCTSKFRKQLQLIPTLLDAVPAAYMGQVRLAERASGSRSAETTLPYNDSPVAAVAEMTKTLALWVVFYRLDGVDVPKPHHARNLAAWLVDELPRIRRHEKVTDLIAGVEFEMKALSRTVDRQPDRWYAGTCGQLAAFYDEKTEQVTFGHCPADLYGYGSPDSLNTIRCRECGAELDPAGRRAYLIEASGDKVANAADLSRILTAYGAPVTKVMISRWKNTKKLEVRAIAIKDRRELYRLGEVQQCLVDHMAAQATRQARKATTEQSTDGETLAS